MVSIQIMLHVMNYSYTKYVICVAYSKFRKFKALVFVAFLKLIINEKFFLKANMTKPIIFKKNHIYIMTADFSSVHRDL